MAFLIRIMQFSVSFCLIKLWFNWYHLNAFFSQSTLNSLLFHITYSCLRQIRVQNIWIIFSVIKAIFRFFTPFSIRVCTDQILIHSNQISHSNQKSPDSNLGICRRFPNRNLRYLLSNSVERKLSSFLDPWGGCEKCWQHQKFGMVRVILYVFWDFEISRFQIVASEDVSGGYGG